MLCSCAFNAYLRLRRRRNPHLRTSFASLTNIGISILHLFAHHHHHRWRCSHVHSPDPACTSTPIRMHIRTGNTAHLLAILIASASVHRLKLPIHWLGLLNATLTLPKLPNICPHLLSCIRRALYSQTPPPPTIAIPANNNGNNNAKARNGHAHPQAKQQQHSLTSLRRAVAAVSGSSTSPSSTSTSTSTGLTTPTSLTSLAARSSTSSKGSRDNRLCLSPSSPSPSSQVRPRPRARAPPLSPTMHSRASIYLETSAIEDEESRRLSEAAFLDF